MNDKKFISETIQSVNKMADCSDLGPSGFWIDEEHEGCGNPEIFLEFKTTLKQDKYISKNRYICPWNKAVLYGNGNGNIDNVGCYYSCAISNIRYLPSCMLKEILLRFKARLENGEYDNLNHIEPLLNEKEIEYIEKAKLLKLRFGK